MDTGGAWRFHAGRQSIMDSTLAAAEALQLHPAGANGAVRTAGAIGAVRTAGALRPAARRSGEIHLLDKKGEVFDGKLVAGEDADGDPVLLDAAENLYLQGESKGSLSAFLGAFWSKLLDNKYEYASGWIEKGGGGAAPVD